MLERIKHLCKENEITVCELEKKLGFGNGAIRKWDSSSPSISNVTKVANYFNVTIQYLVDEEPLSQDAIEIATIYDKMPKQKQSLVKCYLSVI